MQSKIVELNINEIEAVVGGLATRFPKPPVQQAPPIPTGMNGQNARPSAPTSTQSVSAFALALG
jgi:hypothetical protein